MAQETWAFTAVARDGAETYGFDSKRDADEARREILDTGIALFVSSVMRMVVGERHWTIHIRHRDGGMQSFGFDSKTEAQKFHDVVLKNGVAEVASFPVKTELFQI